VQTLLGVVAEKTGYPQEMLDLGMGLDTDLGIDSIKRVEILSALRERLPDAPTVEPEHLGELQTLAQLAEFLGGGVQHGRESLASDPGPSRALPGPASAHAPNVGEIEAALLAIVGDKTGYPTEMLELSMGLDTDLGIDSIKRVEILSALRERLPDAPTVEPHHLGELQTLGQIVEFLCAGSEARQVPGRPSEVGRAAEGRVERSDSASARATQTGSSEDGVLVSTTLFGIVSDKTGYPVEMLEPSMGLDEDLGIDSIKRVEILSALQERLPDAPAITPEHLADLRTLADIVQFLSVPHGTDASSRADSLTSPDRSGPEAHRREASGSGIERYVLETVPLTAPTKETRSLAGVVAVTSSGDGLSAAIVEALLALGCEAQEITLEAAVAGNGKSMAEHLGGLIVVAPSVLPGTGDDMLRQAFLAVRRLGSKLAAKGDGSLLASVSRMDGRFGLGGDARGEMSFVSGGLAGLVKTAGWEWPGLCCRAIDLEVGESVENVGTAVASELLSEGPREVGIDASGRRVGLQVVRAPLSAAPKYAPGILPKEDLVLISGGGRGVTAEVAVAMAEAGARRIALLGRTAVDEEEPPWLASQSDESSITRALLERSSEQLSPVEVTARSRRVLAAREIRANLARIEVAGAQVSYHSVDVRDAQAVKRLVQGLTDDGRRVGTLVHGAGVLADRRIEDKSEEDFARVYETKVSGLRNLLSALPPSSLDEVVLFSSTTGRFGRRGQADYAVANEVLNKWAQRLASAHPECKVLSLAWGPWNGGMVTPALRRIFDDEGVQVIDLDTGAQQVVRELAGQRGAAQAEVLLLGSGSTLPADSWLEARRAGEEVLTDPAQTRLEKPSLEKRPPELPTVFGRRVAIDDHVFLASQVLDGRGVLPTAVTMEWLAHGALHGNPGLRFRGIDELRVPGPRANTARNSSSRPSWFRAAETDTGSFMPARRWSWAHGSRPTQSTPPPSTMSFPGCPRILAPQPSTRVGCFMAPSCRVSSPCAGSRPAPSPAPRRPSPGRSRRTG
jgi:NAD(P)-dependent dehydrogenase (short-subunit alcohol dehydrogenase family)/acyl carrier protein